MKKGLLTVSFMAKHPRNFVAKELWTPKFRPKVEKPAKKEDWKKELEMEDTNLDSLGEIFKDNDDWD